MNGTTFEMHEEDGVPVARLSGEVDISRAAAIRLDLLRALSNLHHGLVVVFTTVAVMAVVAAVASASRGKRYFHTPEGSKENR